MTQSRLTLKDRPDIENQLKKLGMHLSEFSFPNLYLFRGTHEYEIIRTRRSLFISGLTYDKKRYLMPLSHPADVLPDIQNFLLSDNWDFVFPVAESWLDAFDSREHSHSPDDSDYLFYTEKFKTYPGKKMHKKKNLLNQFQRNHETLLIPLTDDVNSEAKDILEIWQNASEQEIAASDYYQCMEALELREQLGLTGALAFADGQPAGFLIGEPLNSETFTIHFAKADIRFKGVYQFLFSRFACDFCGEYKWMNLEQDMGNEGLRKTKTSYRPDLMAHKFRVSTG